MPIKTMRKPDAGRPGIGSDQRWNIRNTPVSIRIWLIPTSSGTTAITAVEPGVALPQERKGEDPEQWRHKARDQQPWKLAARPRLVRMFRHRVPRAV